MIQPRKLIEVALPLDAINIASAREKSIRHGHPSTLHLWWARRPLAAARAVLFAQLVDDPSSHPDRFPSEEAVLAERDRLHKIIERLVLWENTTNEEVLNEARAEIWSSWRHTCAANQDHPRAAELFNPDKLPAFHDPFAGGGAIPLEAQRLGLESYASDLNPVAVLINKAMIEIPPKFAGQAPVNPEARADKRLVAQQWKGAQGLAEDVRYYGQWMRAKAEERIGHLYPKVEITAEMAQERPDLKPLVGKKLTVIAWLWARTVKSPNPAFSHVDVPLITNFMLSTGSGKEAYVKPVIEGDDYRFTVEIGTPIDGNVSGTSAGKRKAFRCILSGTPIDYNYIRLRAKAGHMSQKLMAVVAEGPNGRVYLSPCHEIESAASIPAPDWKPSIEIPKKHRNFQPPVYGMETFGDLFTNRQLLALTTFSNLIEEVRKQVLVDGLAIGLSDDMVELDAGGKAATAYADAVCLYLAFAVDKGANYWSSMCAWHSSREIIVSTFGRQAIPMVWDFAEANPLGDSTGNWLLGIEQAARMLDNLGFSNCGFAVQADAQHQTISESKIVSTDPPYYDNIAYADLSDFFYVWLRKSLRTVFPSVFTTLEVPKDEELVATTYRHRNKEEANAFFLDGMTAAMRSLADQAIPTFPITIYYAFKQSESSDSGIASTGWESFLDAVMQAGLGVVGTWPMRTEYTGNLKGKMNALASSIILVCRKRNTSASAASRRDFITALKATLPSALHDLQYGGIAPVDLAQASIGPGMAVFTRYAQVIENDGSRMSVRTALALINEQLYEVLEEEEGDYDSDTRWAIDWFKQYGFTDGPFGDAQTLSNAKVTSVEGMRDAGILYARAGKVHLLGRAELPEAWSPTGDARLTVWEITQHMIRALESQGGEAAAAAILAAAGPRGDRARQLAYHLYSWCERQNWAEEARAYNGLGVAWQSIRQQADNAREGSATQARLI